MSRDEKQQLIEQLIGRRVLFISSEAHHPDKLLPDVEEGIVTDAAVTRMGVSVISIRDFKDRVHRRQAERHLMCVMPDNMQPPAPIASK